ncbi:MAG: hypothetical protein HY513_05010 [Candidatus Aenigmarchaeota archaeon]|nr:hypothetical protein [Candidatus Aenigmarchaeota archaeon]
MTLVLAGKAKGGEIVTVADTACYVRRLVADHYSDPEHLCLRKVRPTGKKSLIGISGEFPNNTLEEHYACFLKKVLKSLNFQKRGRHNISNVADS